MLEHTGGSATLADNVEIVVGDGADLTVVSIDDWDDDAVHVGHRHAKVGRDARFKHVDVTFGGSVVRHDTTAEYAGPGGEVEMLGLYFADEGQHIEHRLFVDHTAPKTKSHVTYKGALQGEGAHSVWVGDVLIRKVAEGIETFETNRNLVLTDGCRADSVPNLEIETGEIKGAGHASATGRFDDEQLFYLRSRGIAEDEARRLVVHGFFNDLIRRIDVPELEEQLAATVEAELGQERRSRRPRLVSFEPRLFARRVPRRRGDRCQGRRPGDRRGQERRRVLRGRGHLLPRRGSAERGRGRGLHGRVLVARLALRPPDRQAHRTPRHRARLHLSRRGTRHRCVRRRHHHPERSHPAMSTLEIKDLHVTVKTDDEDKEILKGVTLTIKDGETHAIMGPNGSGKSTLAYSIAGHPKYTVTSGTVTLDGADVLAMTVDQRARAGLFLAMQYPVEVPGVSVSNFLRTAKTALDGEAPKLRTWVKDVNAALEQLNLDPTFGTRSVNEGFSGGEKKRHEIVQLELLNPAFAILDETDSGLDIDALKVVSEGVNRFRAQQDRGVLLITHYTRILRYIQPDFVHVFVAGRIAEQGGAELAEQLEAEGYDKYVSADVARPS